MTLPSVRFAFVALSACFLAAASGCAAPKNAAYPDTPAPRTVEEAEAQINDARAALGLPPARFESDHVADGLADSTNAPEDARPAPTSPAAPPPPPAAAPQRAPSRAPVWRAEEVVVSTAAAPPAESACTRACRAFASMRRASEALCRLAGENDARCTEARRVVHESEARLAGCGC